MPNVLVTIEVRVPPDVAPKQLVDEISSNLESCNWTVVHTYYEIIERDDHEDL